MRIDLRHLRILVTIAEAGSIRRAAARLRIAQPALTRQLHRIEEALGYAVFVRTAQGVEPSAPGTETLAQARAVLADVDELWAGTQEILTARRPDPPLRVGGVLGAYTDALVPVAGALSGGPVTSHGHRLVSRLVDLLAAGQLDLAVLHEFPGFDVRLPSTLDRAVLRSEPIFAALADGHPLAARREINLGQLSSMDWAMPQLDDGGLHASFQRACADAGFTPRVRHWTTDSSASAALVVTGTVVCGLYPTTYELPGVRAVPLAGAPLRRRLLLAWRRDCPAAGLAGELTERLHAWYEDVAAQRPAYRAWRAGNLACTWS
ncbi:LysR family transcriptional regulator [Longispora albida]|uniref:LysR family transcriptional regulator n=1 Tax=Longispora albida TaxID=203523 RepID=UPI0003739F8B|nr:LysR substrate-binding domain-containing protein [Longispora albida]